MDKIWLFSFNFLMFSGFAFISPFFVLYYQSLQFSGTQIGILTGVTPLIYLFSAPALTGIADSTGRHRLIMGLCLGAVMVFALLFPFVETFFAALVLAVLINIFFGPVTSFVDSATMYMLGNAKEMYGRIRLGGTLGWGIAALAAGTFVQYNGLRAAFFVSAAIFLLVFLISWKLVYNPAPKQASAWTGVRNLLINPLWIRFLLIALVGGLAFSVGNNYLFPYMKEVGAEESLMGIALTVGTLTEIPALFYGNRLLARLQAYRLLMLAMFITGLRLLLFGVVSTPVLVLAVQLLSGLTFPVMWIAGVAYAYEHAPAGLSATAQGLFGAMVLGFGSAIGGMLGGVLLEAMTAQQMYLLMGMIIWGALILISGVWRFVLKDNLPAT